MDAMTHAIEGYVSVDWSAHQDARSLHALRMIRDNLERAVERGEEDEEARGNMLVAANLAITIALGSVTRCPTRPGLSSASRTAWRTPSTCRRDPPQRGRARHIADRYRDIGEVFGLAEPDIGDGARRLRHRPGGPARTAHPALSQVGVPEDGIPRWWRARWATAPRC